MKLHLQSNGTPLLFFLLVADFVFITLHIFHELHILPNESFSVEKDGGYAERFQYLKELGIFLGLVWIARRRTQLCYAAWALLFFYLLLDDALSVHERLGFHVSNYLEFSSAYGLRAQDYGELCISSLASLCLFSLIWIATQRSNARVRADSKLLFALVCVLALFGIVVDMVHIMLDWGEIFWATMEDGGEMLVMSVIASCVANMESETSNYQSPDKAPAP